MKLSEENENDSATDNLFRVLQKRFELWDVRLNLLAIVQYGVEAADDHCAIQRELAYMSLDQKGWITIVKKHHSQSLKLEDIVVVAFRNRQAMK